MAAELTEKEKKQWGIGCFIAGAIFFALLYGCPSERKPDTRDAWYYAQQFAKKDMLSPEKAKFPKYSEIRAKSIEKNKFQVRGYVDSQNAFGATVRLHFKAELSTDGKKWYCNEIRWEQ